MRALLAAKQAATIDNISGGRFGLNVVCGWFRPEIEMFGIELLDHDDRYRMADEWLTCMKRAWTEQDFDHEGPFYTVRGGFLLPKPVQRPHPPIVIGGSGKKRTLAVAARWAQHWDGGFADQPRWQEANEALIGHCERLGRDHEPAGHAQVHDQVPRGPPAALEVHHDELCPAPDPRDARAGHADAKLTLVFLADRPRPEHLGALDPAPDERLADQPHGRLGSGGA